MKIKAIIFDMDGVLVNSKDFIKQAFLNSFEKYKVKNIPDDFFECHVGEGLSSIYTKLASSHNLKKIVAEHKKWQINNHDRLIKFYPKVKETLEELKRKNIRLAILTSRSGASTLKSLKKAGVVQLFNTIIRGQDIKRLKPNPEGLNKTVAKFGFKKEDVLYVGDTKSDSQAAQNAGVKFVAASYGLVDKKVLEYPHDYSINKFSDILKIVK